MARSILRWGAINFGVATVVTVKTSFFALIKPFVKWLMFRVVHPLSRKLPYVSRKRHILLLCNGTQMVEHLSELWELFEDDQNLIFHLFLLHGDRCPGEMERVNHKLPVRIIKNWELQLKCWDLVVIADHLHYISHWNVFSFPILRIPHGSVCKRVNGELYAFGRDCYDKNGKIRYTRMFVYNETERRMAIEVDPEFSDKVVVAGNLKSDRLLDKSRDRNVIRHRLGVGQDETLVLIASTFGPNCLFNIMGDALLSEARQLSGQFRFALSVHPLEHSSKATGERSWEERLSVLRAEGFLVLDPGEDWEPYIVACDIILTDHTSLSLYGLPLGRPYIYAPVPETVIEKYGLTWQLMDISPTLRPDASNLTECLMQAMNEYPLEKLKELNEKFCSYPGEAKARTRQAVYDMLAK